MSEFTPAAVLAALDSWCGAKYECLDLATEAKLCGVHEALDALEAENRRLKMQAITRSGELVNLSAENGRLRKVAEEAEMAFTQWITVSEWHVGWIRPPTPRMMKGMAALRAILKEVEE